MGQKSYLIGNGMRKQLYHVSVVKIVVVVSSGCGETIFLVYNVLSITYVYDAY